MLEIHKQFKSIKKYYLKLTLNDQNFIYVLSYSYFYGYSFTIQDLLKICLVISTIPYAHAAK